MTSEDEKTPVAALLWIGAAVLVLGLFALVRVYAVADTKLFGVAQENAQTQVFEQSKTYRDATRRDLEDLMFQYTQARDPASKAAVLSLLRHRAQGAPPDLVPSAVSALLDQAGRSP